MKLNFMTKNTIKKKSIMSILVVIHYIINIQAPKKDLPISFCQLKQE